MDIQKMIAEKEAQRAQLAERSKKSDDVAELRSINEQMEAINKDIADLHSIAVEAEKNERTKAINQAEHDARAKDIDPERGFEKRGKAELDGAKEAPEKRNEDIGKAIREGRSVTVATGNIVLPKYNANTINSTFLEVSNLIDNVSSIMLPGGESYTQPYEVSTAAGTYTAEGAAASDTDMAFGYADITKAKVTAYSEITEEIEKLPAAPYADTVLAGITRSLRKKLAAEIMVGAGTANTLTGIFSDKATAIDKATDMTLAKIDNTTLDDIVYSYGGDEAVEGACVLILNKKDLAAFAKLRNTDGSKFHDIKPAGNGGSGTIDGVPYIINSACGAVSDTATKADTYCMAYGNLANYQLTVFSDVDVEKSKDYKFKEGMVAHRGVMYAGGNVVSHNGFIRVKKAATA